MYYTVYKITNKINGKIYIGKHKTNDLDDGYFGSGKVLKRAIKKHSNETKSKIKATMQKNNHQKGEKNSQFGTCWINNGIVNKKISKKDIDIWIEQGYNKGRISS